MLFSKLKRPRRRQLRRRDKMICLDPLRTRLSFQRLGLNYNMLYYARRFFRGSSTVFNGFEKGMPIPFFSCDDLKKKYQMFHVHRIEDASFIWLLLLTLQLSSTKGFWPDVMAKFKWQILISFLLWSHKWMTQIYLYGGDSLGGFSY